jgi:hypothetical protein
LTLSYRFTAALATVALAVGASTAFADGGHGSDDHGNGDNHGQGDDHGGRQNDQHKAAHHDNATVLRADLFGSQPAGPVLFGVKPGGAPWVIREGSARVRRNGRVTVRVEGLVIPTAPQNGTNPLSNIAATVYCGGAAVGTTKAAAFSTAGDARIDDTLATPLPSPCLAPAVLLNPAPAGVVSTAAYIAASGA